MGRGRLLPTDPCHFEDSDGRCHAPESRGVCAPPPSGRPSALIQHADLEALCRQQPPYGFKPLCAGGSEAGPDSLPLLRRLRDPARCHYPSCAVVGASGTLLGARLGASIDAHDAVIRVNLAPDARESARARAAPHRHEPTWAADIGARTTWRVMTMEGYGYLNHYARFWLQPPLGHGVHPNMSGVPQEPLLAISCHAPTGKRMGRCRYDRLKQTFDHPHSASHLISPLLLNEIYTTHFRKVRGQRTPSTGMTAIAFARQLCGAVHLYGFGNGSCGEQCYHYYDCGPTSTNPTQTHFLEDEKLPDARGRLQSATGGFHNFSAQAVVLRGMVERGEVVAHWGRCDRNDGGPPLVGGKPIYLSVPRSRGRARGRGRGRGKGRG